MCIRDRNNLVTERNAAARHYNILMRWQMASEPDPEMLQEIFSLPELEEGTWFYRTRVSYWAGPSQETEEFAANGGFADVDPDHYSVCLLYTSNICLPGPPLAATLPNIRTNSSTYNKIPPQN